MIKRKFKIVNDHENGEAVILYNDNSYKTGYKTKKDAMTKCNYLQKHSRTKRPKRVYFDGEFWRLTKKEEFIKN